MWFQLLEKLLPARQKVDVPVGEHVEEVNLTDYETVRGTGRGATGQAYDEDDSDDEGQAGGGQRVQCAHQ